MRALSLTVADTPAVFHAYKLPGTAQQQVETSKTPEITRTWMTHMGPKERAERFSTIKALNKEVTPGTSSCARAMKQSL